MARFSNTTDLEIFVLESGELTVDPTGYKVTDIIRYQRFTEYEVTADYTAETLTVYYQVNCGLELEKSEGSIDPIFAWDLWINRNPEFRFFGKRGEPIKTTRLYCEGYGPIDPPPVVGKVEDDYQISVGQIDDQLDD